MERPEKQRVIFLQKEITQAIKKLAQIVQIEEETITQLKQAYEGCRLRAAQNLLKNIEIEELNKDKAGIRLNLLKENGINNISDIFKFNEAALQEIHGIGDETAKKIMRRAEAIRDDAVALSSVRLELDSSNPFMNTLIFQLARTMNTRNIYENARKLLDEHGSYAKKAVDQCEELLSGFNWLFSTKNKKNSMVNAYQYLETLYQKDFTNDMEKLFSQYMSAHGVWTEANSIAAFEKNSAPFYAWMEKMSGKRADAKVRTGSIEEELAQKIDAFALDTSLLKATLRSYQEFGTKYILHQKKVLLGDEMGLGKTIQAIAAMTHLAAIGKNRFLVVCPVSVKINWMREIENKSELKVMEIHGDDKLEEFAFWQEHGGIAVTTYETLVRIDVDSIKGVDFCIVDEAHMMKNPSSQRTQAMQNLLDDCEYICLMTGTPLENKVSEMVFLISNLNPSIAKLIEEKQSFAKAKEFRKEISPVYLRRVREEVLKELPEKTELEEWCDMTREEEICYYKALLGGDHALVRRVSFHVPDVVNSTKAKRIWEIAESARENGHKVLVFSFFLDTLHVLQELFKDRCVGVITGSVPADKRQEIVDVFSESGAGSILFSQIVAGGVGLNIQSASVVIICEPQWKPSMENQAIARAYRMGQVNHVFVHHLLTRNSVDEAVLKILYGKAKLFDLFANESEINEASKAIQEQKAMKQIVEEELKRHEYVKDMLIEDENPNKTENK